MNIDNLIIDDAGNSHFHCFILVTQITSYSSSLNHSHPNHSHPMTGLHVENQYAEVLTEIPKGKWSLKHCVQ